MPKQSFLAVANVLSLRIFGVGAVLGMQIILVRLLGKSEFDLYSYVMTWVTILVLPCAMGFDTMFLRFLPSYLIRKKHALLKGMIHTGIGVAGAISLLAGILMALAAVFLPMEATMRWAFLAGAIFLPITTLMELARAGLQAMHHAFWGLLPKSLGVPAIMCLLGGAGLMVNLTLSAAMALTAQTILGLLCLITMSFFFFRLLRSHISHVNPTYRRSFWVKNAIPMFLIQGSQLLCANASIIALGLLKGPDDVGYYRISVLMGNFSLLGMMAAISIIAPRISAFYTEKKKQMIQYLLSWSALGVGIFTLCVIIGFVLLGEFILGWFGEFCKAGYIPLLILLGGFWINTCCGPSGLLLSMTGRQYISATVFLIGAMCIILLGLFLIPPFGPIGAAISTAIVVAGQNTVLAIIVWKKLGVNSSIFSIRHLIKIK